MAGPLEADRPGGRLIVLLTAFLLGGGALAVEYQLGPWQSAGRMRALDPELDMPPSVLPDTSVAILHGEQVEQFGISFQLPSKHPEKVTELRNALVLSGEGGTILFQDPSSGSGTPHIMRELAKSVPDLSSEERNSICGLQRLAMQAKTETGEMVEDTEPEP